jgi:hypothetical protein
MGTVKVGEFNFPQPGSDMFRMTCSNHPTAEYLTKNPYQRGLHLIKGPVEFGGFAECPCPFSDLVVIVED